jgi:hypothetical protein
MPKTPPPGRDAPVPPQLRPDEAIVTDQRPRPYHYHGELGDEWPTTPVKPDGSGGKGLLRRAIFDPTDPNTMRHIVNEHDGVNTDDVHRHDPEAGKYLFLPGSVEDRIDMHPRAAAMLPTAEHVFFVLEGVLKNDAVLSAGECVFSVPSVTLWNPREIQWFAREHLQGKTVFVVPDADWIEKEMVDRFALTARTYLREVLGEDRAFVAAPPPEFYRAMRLEAEARGERDPELKGVDDWLGTHGRDWAARERVRPGIEGLVIRGREPGYEITRPWHWGNALRHPLSEGKGMERNLPNEGRALRMLSLLGPTHQWSLGGIASIMNVSARGYAERAVPVLCGP